MKKFLSLALSAVLVLSLGAVSAFGYADTAGHYGENAVSQWGYLLAADTSGYFNPDAPVTRAEFAHVVNALAKYPAASPTFNDVGGSQYASDIGALQKAGVVVGTVAGTKYSPDKTLTRQEAARMLGLAFGLPVSGTRTTFADDASIADWAKPYVEALKTVSYLQGQGANTFGPVSSLTRAEIMQIAFNITPGTEAPNANFVIDKAGTYSGTYNNVVIAANVSGVVEFKDATINGTLTVLGQDAAKAASAQGQLNDTLNASVIPGLTINITGRSNITNMFCQTLATVNVYATVGTMHVQQSLTTVNVYAGATVTYVSVTRVATAVTVNNWGTITTIQTATTDTTIINRGVIVTARVTTTVVITGNPPRNQIIIDTTGRQDPYNN